MSPAVAANTKPQKGRHEPNDGHSFQRPARLPAAFGCVASSKSHANGGAQDGANAHTRVAHTGTKQADVANIVVLCKAAPVAY